LAAPGTPYNLDQWDGYPAARRRLVDRLREVDNPVVLSGDVHASCVCVVTADPQDPTSPPAVPELVGTSITSEFPARWAPLVRAAAEALPTIRDRKSTRLNSSHVKISYAVFCLKKKNESTKTTT